MDLNTLPDELLATVMHHISYKNLTGIRKMDSRCDAVAKRFDLIRIPVSRVEYHMSMNKTNNRQVVKLELDVDADILGLSTVLNYHEKTNRHSVKDINEETLKLIMKKIQVNGVFGIVAIYASIEEKLLSLFCENKKFLKKCNHLVFLHSDASHKFTSNTFKKLLSSCPVFDRLAVVGYSDKNVIINTEMLGRRKWKELRFSEDLERGVALLGINRTFLYEIAKYCENLHIWTSEKSLNIDINDVLDYIEDSLEDNSFIEKQKWSIANIGLGNSTVKYVLERINKNLQLRLKRTFHDDYQIEILSKPDIYIELGCHAIRIELGHEPMWDHDIFAQEDNDFDEEEEDFSDWFINLNDGIIL